MSNDEDISLDVGSFSGVRRLMMGDITHIVLCIQICEVMYVSNRSQSRSTEHFPKTVA